MNIRKICKKDFFTIFKIVQLKELSNITEISFSWVYSIIHLHDSGSTNQPQFQGSFPAQPQVMPMNTGMMPPQNMFGMPAPNPSMALMMPGAQQNMSNLLAVLIANLQQNKDSRLQWLYLRTHNPKSQ